MSFSPTASNRSYGVWVWISSQGSVSWPFCPCVPRPELQPAFSRYFHLPKSGLCWPLGIAWIASFQAKSELMKTSNAALKPKLKQSNLFFFFLRCPGPISFCQVEMTGNLCVLPKATSEILRVWGFCLSFLEQGEPKIPKVERGSNSTSPHTLRGGSRDRISADQAAVSEGST